MLRKCGHPASGVAPRVPVCRPAQPFAAFAVYPEEMAVRLRLGGSGDPTIASRYREEGPRGYRDDRPPYRAPRRKSRFWKRLLLTLGVLFVAVLLVGFGVFAYYYAQYAQVVDERLQNPLFEQTAKIYAAPRELRIGQTMSVEQIASNLRAAGYSEGGSSALGTFHRDGYSIFVQPGAQSFHAPIGAVVRTDGTSITGIQQQDGTPLAAYQLEPVLITGLSEEKTRTKRRLVTYNEIPRNLVNAVLAIEDRRFFTHGGRSFPGVFWQERAAARPVGVCVAGGNDSAAFPAVALPPSGSCDGTAKSGAGQHGGNRGRDRSGGRRCQG